MKPRIRYSADSDAVNIRSWFRIRETQNDLSRHYSDCHILLRMVVRRIHIADASTGYFFAFAIAAT